MDLTAVAAAVVLGLCAGLLSGLVGVGGGILLVPALSLLLGLGQVEAEATSLLAMAPVAAVGALRQRGFGNLRLADGLSMGALALAGAYVGTELAHALPERALELLFAGVLALIASRLVHRALRSGDAAASDGA